MTDEKNDVTKSDDLIKTALELGGQDKNPAGQPETKAGVSESDWRELDHEPCPFSGERRLKDSPPGQRDVRPMTSDDEYLKELVRQWRKEKGVMSCWWLKLFVWAFALDRPVWESRRGLFLSWLIFGWACLRLDWRMLKLTCLRLYWHCASLFWSVVLAWQNWRRR